MLLKFFPIDTGPVIVWGRISQSHTSEKNILSKRSVDVLGRFSDDRRSLKMRDERREREKEKVCVCVRERERRREREKSDKLFGSEESLWAELSATNC